MSVLPLRARLLHGEKILFTNDAGHFFAAEEGFADRYLADRLNENDRNFLAVEGQVLDAADPVHFPSHAHSVSRRLERAKGLDYLILVPTLRCNLSCSYCQVSRVNVDRMEFDWSEQTLAAVLTLIDGLPSDRLKVEFQGGEPTLRIDLIQAVVDRCERFKDKQFVICTNLAHLSDELFQLLDNPNLFISTSLDGDAPVHSRNRTKDAKETHRFFSNLQAVLDRYGPEKVSALPTIDPAAPPAIDDLIDSYSARGLTSIYLRPINFHGFARKRHAASQALGAEWRAYYEAFVRRLIARNWKQRDIVLEEAYLSLCLRRIFQPGRDRHVDLRNPNPVGADYVVIDHDGIVYPTDEARMLSRSGVIDLAIGHVTTGWNTEQREILNAHSTNQWDPACQRCAYQPYCGRDTIDDIARYGRIDMPRHQTEFCRRHLHLFDFIFSLIYSADEATRYSLSRWLRLPGQGTPLGVLHQ